MKKSKSILSILMVALLLFLTSCSSAGTPDETTTKPPATETENQGIVQLTAINDLDIMSSYADSDIYGDTLLISTNRYYEDKDSTSIGIYLYDLKENKIINSRDFTDDDLINGLYETKFDDDGNIVAYGWNNDGITETKVVLNQDLEQLSSEKYKFLEDGDRENSTNPLIDSQFVQYQPFARLDEGQIDSTSRLSAVGFYNEDCIYLVDDNMQNYLASVGKNILCTLDDVNEDNTVDVAVINYNDFTIVNQAKTPVIDNADYANVSMGSMSDKYAFIALDYGTPDGNYYTMACAWDYSTAPVNTPITNEKLDEDILTTKTDDIIADVKDKFGVNITIDKKGEEEFAPVDENGETGLEYGASKNKFTTYYIVSQLQAFMEKLPENFTQEMTTGYLYDENNHNGFDINIVKNIKGSAAAYAGGSSNNHMHIVFATEEFALSQIPHEFMHLIDNRIYDYYAYNATDAFSDGFDDLWMNLNKDGFVYDDDADYDGNYFVSYYAMTNWLEDRAETFMYLCDESYGTDWYTSNKYLKKKADFLIDAIRLAFPSVQKADSVYWTRNIKN